MNFSKTNFLLFFFIFLFFTKTKAQKPFDIRGVVIDAQTLEPLPNVNIAYFSKTKIGTTSDESGVFQIKITVLPTTLAFSFVGYASQLLKIKNNKITELVIKLRPAAAPLPEIIIAATQKMDTVFFKPYSVVDYVFLENKILLLAHRNSLKKYTLIALDEKTNELITEFSLEDYLPKGLLQHCTGEVFLVTASHAYEIAIGATGIFFPKKIPLDNFYLIDHPCIFANENFLYFERYFYQGQALEYHAFARPPHYQNDENTIPADSLEKYAFPLIQNEENIIRLIEEVGLRMPWSGDIWDNNINDRLLTLKESDYSLRGMMKVFYPKLNAPMFQRGNEMILFNHEASELQFFTEKGDSLRTIPINYHKNRKWKKQILFDPIQQRAYTSFNTRWGEKIRAIDLEKGTLSTALSIDLAFIEKPKIRDGFIYFLYKNTWEGERRRMLYRMRVF
ncbi:MAG TPA: carboxypeptidase-like regulatory domain-containing protein [Phaeodactylibacter sp.]|nr:carboxypeptidase-like regulatory domain-containing protein [Phaeodactylibacter sp.]